MKNRKLTTLIEVQALRLPRKFSYSWLTYTYVQMSKSQDRPCHETRSILCAKFVDVHKVMVHASFKAPSLLGSNMKIFKFAS